MMTRRRWTPWPTLPSSAKTAPADPGVARLPADAEPKTTTVIATTVPQPTAGVLPWRNLTSLENWRAFIHQAVPVLVPVLVAINITTQDVAMMWLPFVFAIVDNVLSAGNTVDKLRRAIYAAAGVLQTGGLLATVLGDFAPDYVTVAGAVLTVLSGFLARFYTPTTTLVSQVTAT